MARRAFLALVITALAAPLAACGRKNAPRQPEGSSFPRRYPAE